MSFRRQKQQFQEIAHPPRELGTPAFKSNPAEDQVQSIDAGKATNFIGENQRQFPRVEPVADLTCELGKILDISIAGIRLAMNQIRPLKAKQSMMIPLAMRDHKILIPAKVVWIKNISGDDDNAPVKGRANDKTVSLRQEIGLRFTSLAPMLTLPESDLMALGLIPSDSQVPGPDEEPNEQCSRGTQVISDLDDLLASHP